MKRLICMYAFLLCLVCVLPAQEREVKLKIVGRKSCTCICVGAKEPGGV